MGKGCDLTAPGTTKSCEWMVPGDESVGLYRSWGWFVSPGGFGGQAIRRGRFSAARKGVRLVVLGFVGARNQTGVISVARKGRFWYCSASKETRKMEPGSRARSLSPQRAA